MTRLTHSYQDAAGRCHDTLEASILSDVEALIGRPATVIVAEHAAALAPLLRELMDARAHTPALRTVGGGK